MKYLIYLGHPAHFHLFRLVVERLRAAGHQVRIVSRHKDVLEQLLRGAGWQFDHVQTRAGKNTRTALAVSLARRDLAVLHIAAAFRPDLMLGTSAEVAHVGRLLGIDSIVLNEDDCDVVPRFARLSYPFASHILAPTCCRVGRWSGKTIAYPGYHELAYLHPNHFTPDLAVAARLSNGGRNRYFVIRLALLDAHHDVGRTGITTAVAEPLVGRLSLFGRVYISAERPLESSLESYRIAIDPLEMHHAIAGASLYIGDSQTMAAEAAVLGTPSLRFNDFVGQIGYLDELEHRYGLTMGIPTMQPHLLLEAAVELAASATAKAVWLARREKMLRECIDLANFLTWFIPEYPSSAAACMTDDRVFDRFKRAAPVIAHGRGSQ